MSGAITITDQGDCLLGDSLLHPGQGALAAARQDLAPLLAGTREGDTLVLAGLGLGWHARAAREHQPAPHLVVYEPDPRRRALAAALGPAWLNGDGTVLAKDDQELIEALAPRLVYGQGGRLALFSPPAYGRAAPEVLAQAREVARQSQSRGRVERANREAKQGLWLEHLALNFKHVLDYPDVSRLAGLARGRAALVVGAGPSLDASLSELRGIDRGCLVLAAASALGPLARAGVAPHLALAMEAKDESRQLAGADPAATVLAAASSSHPAHFSAWPGAMALFHLQPWVVDLIGAGSALPSGGHVGSVAFSLAILLGCHPIILVGQDLAYPGGRRHASGRPGGEEGEPPPTVCVPAIGGGLVETSLVMQSYIAWYQESAAYLARTQPGRRIINASAQGAYLPGFAHLPLAQALEGPSTSSLDFNIIAAALAAQDRPRAGDLGLRLGLARAGLRQALRLLEQGGLEACRRGLDPLSPGAAALHDLPPGTAPQRVREALSLMSATLRSMAEGLYA